MVNPTLEERIRKLWGNCTPTGDPRRFSWIEKRRSHVEISEPTMEEARERARNAAKELAENSARLPVAPKCKYELEELEQHRADLERILFLIGVAAGSKGTSLTVKVAIFSGCDGGCFQEWDYQCGGPKLIADFNGKRLTIETLPERKCALFDSEGSPRSKCFAMDDIQSAIHELMGTTP